MKSSADTPVKPIVRALIRSAPHLVSAREQRDAIVGAHPSAMLYELDGTLEAIRLMRLALAELKGGDVLIVYDINVFAGTTGEVAQTVRNLLELGVEVRVCAEGGLVLSATKDLVGVLSMLAARERRATTIPYASTNQGARRRRPLSVYQTQYAKRLYEQGVPLREIGLIFQASPQEVWDAVNAMRARRVSKNRSTD